MRASVLYVQYVAVRIWKVKNVFDVNRTGGYETSRTFDGGGPCYTEDPVPLTFN